MNSINIWEFGGRISIKINNGFLKNIKEKLFNKYKTKKSMFNNIKNTKNITFYTFNNILKESYNKRFFIPIKVWVDLCEAIGISLEELQQNIEAYKTSNGPNYVYEPILPVRITPIFDMIIAHNIADGTVINPKKGRLPYFGYRQIDPFIRELYIKKLESIFGKINFPNKYYLNSTRPYCPPVLSSLFFLIYNLNTKSFLSRSARIPNEILNKNIEHLLSVLIAFIIDEGNIDSTAIVIRLKNPKLTEDLFNICNKLCYKSTFTYNKDYGNLYILRDGMKKFFGDYKLMLKKYPEINLGKTELKIENSLKIYNRVIYKSKGNRNIILNMLKYEDLTVNQIALRIKMTRQGVRFHIHNIEKENLILKKGFIGKKNIIYTYRG